jgi:hypothetical protein
MAATTQLVMPGLEPGIHVFLAVKINTRMAGTQESGSNADNSNRHCERSEAIHLSAQKKNGLLRRFAPRNDEKKR